MSTVRGSLRGGSVDAPDVDLPAPLRKKMEERSGSDGGSIREFTYRGIEIRL